MLPEYLLLLFIFIVMLNFYMSFNNFFKAISLGSLSGLLCLGGAGYFITDYVSFNLFTVLAAAITGAPGVIAIFIFNRFLS